MTPSDRAALEIGRLFMRAHAAEQQARELSERVAKLEAEVRELRQSEGAEI
jgi:hypothetical protein